MLTNPKVRPYLKRIVWIGLLSLVFTLAFNELVFFMSKDPTDRAPTTIQLVIPPGTAQHIAAGQEEPGIPSEMVFVMGDVLEVKNEDTVSHQLGPVWVPAGSTSRLVLEEPRQGSYTCSFRPSGYFGVDVRLPTTVATRITGLMLGMPTLAVLMFLYSLVALPVKEPEAPKASLNGSGKTA